MDIQTLREISPTIPAWQLGLFVGLISLFMLQGSLQLSLTVAYLFVLYWGFILYASNFVAAAEGNPGTLTLYIGCGLVIAFLALLAFFYEF